MIRRGQVVGTCDPTASENELASMMVGRPVQLTVDKPPAQPGDVVVDIHGLSIVDEAGVVVVDDVSLNVRGGEIYAIAGVQGNGQTELAQALVGPGPAHPRAHRHRRHPDRGAFAPTRSSTSASATSPRTGCTTAWSARSPSPRTWC